MKHFVDFFPNLWGIFLIGRCDASAV